MSGSVPELKSATQLVDELNGGPENTDSSDPRDAKTYTFKFEHRDPRGQLWAGKFTNNILTVRQRRLLKIAKAQLSGAVAVAALDADQWEFNEMLAHLAISLDRTAEDFPTWARDLEALYDENIVVKLYEEVASHEARFHRREPVDQDSSDAG